MFFFMARDRHALTMTLKSFGEDERWSCGIPFEFHAALGKHGQAQEKRIERQGAARFYEACGLSPATTEGAIKVRNEVSTAIANRDETAAEVMAKCSRPDCRSRHTPRSITTKTILSSVSSVTN